MRPLSCENGCGTLKYVAKKKNWTVLSFFLAVFLVFLQSDAFGASISFDLKNDKTPLSGDLSVLEKVYQPRVIENAKDYRLPSGTRLIKAEDLEDGLRLMFVGSGLSKNGRFSDIKLLLLRAAEKKGGKEKVLQRLNLGAGEAPQMQPLSFEGASPAVFVRVMREGFNTEGFVFALNREKTPKLTETLRVDRNFYLRARLNVKGTLRSGGFVEVASAKPEKTVRLNLSDPDAADELIAQGLYQPDGEPIDSLRNLACSRTGSESVEVVPENKIQVGMSLMSLSKKRVVDVTATLESEDGAKWDVTDIDFEPFLPFRSE